MKQSLVIILSLISLYAAAQHHGPMKGNWSASKSDAVYLVRFNIDGDPNSRSSTYFFPGEFSSIPKNKEENFTLTRDAGTVNLNGKFNNEEGSGTWSFSSDKNYVESMKTYGIEGLVEHEWFALFTMGIKKDYPQMLVNNGYKHISKDDLILLGSKKIDESYIRSWKQNGYEKVRLSELVFLNDQHITPAYIESYRALGYDELSLSKVIELKIMGITPEFIKSFTDAGLKNIHIHDLERAKEHGLTGKDVSAMMAKGWKYDNLEKYLQLKLKD